MSETRFTSGPWYVSGVRRKVEGVDCIFIDRYEPDTKQTTGIACVWYDTRTHDGFADSHLIAASPRLYSALEAMVERYAELVNCGDCGHWNPEEEEQVTEARAALSQARGEK